MVVVAPVGKVFVMSIWIEFVKHPPSMLPLTPFKIATIAPADKIVRPNFSVLEAGAKHKTGVMLIVSLNRTNARAPIRGDQPFGDPKLVPAKLL
jgi:hypothetical protein